MPKNRIFGIVRFSVLIDQTVKHKPWSISRSITGDYYSHYKDALFKNDRLQHRFSLFENITLPSLDAQTSDDFTLLVLVSKDLPKQWMTRLQKLAKDRAYLCIVPVDAVKNVGDSALAVINKLVPKRRSFITFRLDDDDALFSEYIEHLQEALYLNKDNFALSFENGLYISCPGADELFLVEEKRYQSIGIGLAYKSSSDKPSTIFHLGNHVRVGRRVDLLVKPQRKAWIRTLYPDSDSQDSIRHKIGNNAEVVTASQVRAITAEHFPRVKLEILTNPNWGSKRLSARQVLDRGRW